jgi:hypothetical protein
MNSLFITGEMLDYYRKYYRCMYLVIIKSKNYYVLTLSCILPTKDVGMFGLAVY